MAYSQKILQFSYDKLPDALKDAIFSVDMAKQIIEIAKKAGVPEKTEDISKQIGLVILGLLSPSGLAANMQKELNLDEKISREIENGAKEKIFKPLEKELSVFYPPEDFSTEPKPKGPDPYRESI